MTIKETVIPGLGSCGPRVIALTASQILHRQELTTVYLTPIQDKPDYEKWRNRLLGLMMCSDDEAISIILRQSVPKTLIMLHKLIEDGHYYIETGPQMIGEISQEEAERLGLLKPRRPF